ncbi:hypothetical protein [Mycobacterium sp. E2733]|uniref:hypothetical protein n=1 Tax=Mycobacterium sp. E2733 TaxID=1834138 RepID=UPI0034D01051
MSVPPAWAPITSVVGSTTPAMVSRTRAADRPVIPERLPGHTFQQTLMAMVSRCDASLRG